ncbi:glycosyltransferase [Sulfurimonas sp. SAG-AH-194-C21]|nr:glycosyltransferase [Sulfurimonas sp. SAG-AH-194-C21]MDF1884571.1 glycosyltransferase [Sulfurimonas sp. SAG-AH-194-C21]
MSSRLDVDKNIWTKFNDNFFVKYYNDTKINVISLPLLFNLWRDIKGKDLVHIQYIFSTSTAIAILYASLLGKPIVLSSRGALCKWCLAQGSKYKNIWLKVMIKPYLKNISWHATAEQEKNEILNVFPEAKVNIIPNGIEYEKFQIFNKLDITKYTEKYIGEKIDASKIVVSMGRLQKKKGFDILIDAFEKVTKIDSSIILLIAGQDEGEKLNLLEQIKSLNLEKNVFLVGNIEGQDKIDFFANANLFALTSHNENFGNVYIESLASGTPIIASKGTPWSEVEDYNCGRWVDNNALDMGNAIIEVLKKDTKEMMENSRKLAKKYDWSIIANNFKNYYSSVI